MVDGSGSTHPLPFIVVLQQKYNLGPYKNGHDFVRVDTMLIL